jgi:hypothetical protein
MPAAIPCTHETVLACGIGPDGLIYPLAVGLSGMPRVIRTPAQNTALATSKVLKAAAGTFYGASVEIDATAPTATYYILVLDAAALPANGAVTSLRSISVQHTSTFTDYIEFSDDREAGIAFTTGCVVALSTTRATLTVSGAYLWANGTVL